MKRAFFAIILLLFLFTSCKIYYLESSESETEAEFALGDAAVAKINLCVQFNNFVATSNFDDRLFNYFMLQGEEEGDWYSRLLKNLEAEADFEKTIEVFLQDIRKDPILIETETAASQLAELTLKMSKTLGGFESKAHAQNTEKDEVLYKEMLALYEKFKNDSSSLYLSLYSYSEADLEVWGILESENLALYEVHLLIDLLKACEAQLGEDDFESDDLFLANFAELNRKYQSVFEAFESGAFDEEKLFMGIKKACTVLNTLVFLAEEESENSSILIDLTEKFGQYVEASVLLFNAAVE